MIVVPPVGRLINLCAHAFIKAGETSCSIPLKPSCCHRQRGVHSRERSCNPRLSGWQSAQREKHHMRASAFHSSGKSGFVPALGATVKSCTTSLDRQCRCSILHISHVRYRNLPTPVRFTGELHSQASGPGQCGRIFDPHQEQLVILQRLAAPRGLQSRQ